MTTSDPHRKIMVSGCAQADASHRPHADVRPSSRGAFAERLDHNHWTSRSRPACASQTFARTSPETIGHCRVAPNRQQGSPYLETDNRPTIAIHCRGTATIDPVGVLNPTVSVTLPGSNAAAYPHPGALGRTRPYR